MDIKVKASTSLENDKDLFWAILKADPKVIAHHFGQELVELSEKKNKEKFHRRLDELISMVMNTVQDDIMILAIIKCWFTKYQIPADPSKLSCFDHFHENYSDLVMQSSGLNRKIDIPIL